MLGDENLKAEYDESLNSGASFHGNDNGDDAQGYNAYTFRQWKRRAPPDSSGTFGGGGGGKAPKYDFEEHFKAHYSDKRPKTSSSSFSSSSSTIKSKEDLKRYWQQREADNLDDSINFMSYLNKIFFTFSFFGAIYFLMSYMKSVEEKSNYLKSQQRQIEADKK